jgi:hypothetical protein
MDLVCKKNNYAYGDLVMPSILIVVIMEMSYVAHCELLVSN